MLVWRNDDKDGEMMTIFLAFAGRFHSPVQSLDTDDDGSPVHAGSSHWGGAHSNTSMHCTDPKKKDKGKGQCACRWGVGRLENPAAPGYLCNFLALTEMVRIYIFLVFLC